MKLQTHWYLGILALIGIYNLPVSLAAVQGDAPAYGLANLLWFVWLLYLVPATGSREAG